MQTEYSAIELAPILGKTSRTVSRQAINEGWRYVTRKCKGPAYKSFIAVLLPEPIRIKVARHTAINGSGVTSPFSAAAVSATAAPLGVGAQAGALLGQTRVADTAESAEQARINRERGLAAFNQLPEQRQREAEARLEILQARDAFIEAACLPMKRGSQAFALEYCEGNLNLPGAITRIIGATLSWSTLNRWQQSYKDAGLAGLASGYKSPNKGKTTLSPPQRELIKGLLTAHPHISLVKIMSSLEARFDGSVPHISSVRRYVKRWTKKHQSLLLYIANPDVWKNKHQTAQGDASAQVSRLNQVWEFDSTPTDVMLKDGRYNLIGVIDVYSRRPKLLVSPTSKASAVAALTRRAILDWGIPEIAKTDNGADYVSKHLVRVFEGLEIKQVLCPPFTPESKPHIERFFKTFSHDIMELLPGYIGHSVADRKAIEARRSFADRLMKKGGDPVELNKMTSAELQDICDRWCQAIYEQNQHGGLNGETPAAMARDWTEPVKRITNARALDLLLSEAPGGDGIRTVAKKGVKVDNTYFIAAELPEPGTQVRVLLDATDYGTIYIFDGESRDYICTAVDPIRTGHDRVEIAAKSKAIQKTIMREGSKELKKIARQTAAKDIHMEILEHREGQIAGIVDFPQVAEDYTTPALDQAAKAVIGHDQASREQEEMDELLDDLATERQEETVVYEEKKASGIVPLFTCSTERYQWLRDQIVGGRKLTAEETAFLDEFYQTKAGGMFMDLEGDLRPPVGPDELRMEN
ncbi:MAG: DDE-type integrase/transposase/recombinase [Thermodesulfobacteriota bacterium]